LRAGLAFGLIYGFQKENLQSKKKLPLNRCCLTEQSEARVEQKATSWVLIFLSGWGRRWKRRPFY